MALRSEIVNMQSAKLLFLYWHDLATRNDDQSIVFLAHVPLAISLI